jgi:hypothetical protein
MDASRDAGGRQQQTIWPDGRDRMGNNLNAAIRKWMKSQHRLPDFLRTTRRGQAGVECFAPRA